MYAFEAAPAAVFRFEAGPARTCEGDVSKDCETPLRGSKTAATAMVDRGDVLRTEGVEVHEIQ